MGEVLLIQNASASWPNLLYTDPPRACCCASRRTGCARFRTFTVDAAAIPVVKNWNQGEQYETHLDLDLDCLRCGLQFFQER
jgi:hypothetical protein